MGSAWQVAVAPGLLTVTTGDRRVRLRLPEEGDPVADLQAAQAIVCEWAFDELDELPEELLPGRVVVRRGAAATAMLRAVVAVGLRQALAAAGLGDRVELQPPAARTRPRPAVTA